MNSGIKMDFNFEKCIGIASKMVERSYFSDNPRSHSEEAYDKNSLALSITYKSDVKLLNYRANYN